MKIKSFFAGLMPDLHKHQNTFGFRIFNKILGDPDIFHLTRRSAAGGIATGLFIAFLPTPGHTIIAIICSIFMRINLPLTILFAWTTNPFTVAPVYYLAYRTGAILLDRPVRNVNFEMTWTWFSEWFSVIWPSLLTGCLIFSTISALTSYLLVRIIWRVSVVSKWKKRNAYDTE